MTVTSDKPVVAAFDFDGTLTTGDSLLPFLKYTTGTSKTFFKLALEMPTLTACVSGIVSRGRAKERILKRFFRGIPVALLQEHGKNFAATELKKLLKPQALRRLEWHRELGHYCVLISASVDVYLEPWAAAAGFQNILCSRMEIDPQGLVTGKLLGGNCWGKEKVARLEALLTPIFGARDRYVLHAYGDSRGDRELLAYADFPHFRKMPSTAQELHL